jgi:hypothetical protein
MQLGARGKRAAAAARVRALLPLRCSACRAAARRAPLAALAACACTLWLWRTLLMPRWSFTCLRAAVSLLPGPCPLLQPLLRWS